MARFDLIVLLHWRQTRWSRLRPQIGFVDHQEECRALLCSCQLPSGIRQFSLGLTNHVRDVEIWSSEKVITNNCPIAYLLITIGNVCLCVRAHFISLMCAFNIASCWTDIAVCGALYIFDVCFQHSFVLDRYCSVRGRRGMRARVWFTLEISTHSFKRINVPVNADWSVVSFYFTSKVSRSARFHFQHFLTAFSSVQLSGNNQNKYEKRQKERKPVTGKPNLTHYQPIEGFSDFPCIFLQTFSRCSRFGCPPPPLLLNIAGMVLKDFKPNRYVVLQIFLRESSATLMPRSESITGAQWLFCCCGGGGGHSFAVIRPPPLPSGYTEISRGKQSNEISTRVKNQVYPCVTKQLVRNV